MLSYKREACIFINKVLGLKDTEYEISIDKLEKCDTSFITKSYYCKETDVIYRRTDMEVYFLIEHQSSVDSNMPARIVEYAVEILRDIIKNREKENKRNKKLNKNTKISQTKQKLQPTIIPIVLYTGESKWNVKTYIREVQVEMPGYKNQEFGRYILVDANKYKEEELLKEEEALAKVVLLERSKNIEETYEKINQRKMDEYVEEIIKEYTCNVAKRLLSDEAVEKIREKYKKVGGGKSMLVDYLIRAKEEGRVLGRTDGIKLGRADGIKVGLKEGKKSGRIEEKLKIAKALKNMGLKIEDIEKATKLSKVEIEKL